MSEGISIAPWEFKAELAAAVSIAVLASLLYVALAFDLGRATYIVFGLYVSLATTIGVMISLSLATRVSSSVLLSLAAVTFALLLEEALVNSLDPYAGFALAFIVALVLPLAASTLTVESELSKVLQVAGLMFASRLVFIPFPQSYMRINLALPSAYALIIALVVAFLVVKRITLKSIGFTVGPYRMFKQVSVGVSVGLVGGLVEYSILKPSPIQLAGDALQSILYVVIVMTLFVALAEEMLFRGLLQRSYQNVLPSWSAILMASIQFAVMHLGWLNPLEIAFAYIMGIFLGYSFWKTKSLIAPVTMHSLGNITMFLVAAYPELMLSPNAIALTIIIAAILLLPAMPWRGLLRRKVHVFSGTQATGKRYLDRFEKHLSRALKRSLQTARELGSSALSVHQQESSRIDSGQYSVTRPVTVVCAYCGRVVTGGERYCDVCGHELFLER